MVIFAVPKWQETFHHVLKCAPVGRGENKCLFSCLQVEHTLLEAELKTKSAIKMKMNVPLAIERL